VINIGATTAKTTSYVVSATAGGVAPQADLVSTNKIVYLGYATGTTGAFVVKINNTGAVV
jgi:fibrillarin-like rRNA methylase